MSASGYIAAGFVTKPDPRDTRLGIKEVRL